jgi:hypothetical protein
MYLIYFYSNITDELIPKNIIYNDDEIEKSILNIIRDIIIFEEGIKKADNITIFNEDEKILFDGLDEGIYIKKMNNKYYFHRKYNISSIERTWFSYYNKISSNHKTIGYLSFCKIPIISTKETFIINTNNNKILEIKDVINEQYKNVSENNYANVLDEMKKKFKIKNA